MSSFNMFQVKLQGKYKDLCGEKDVECKQGGEKGARREEKVFENEDYIYTQSVP